jgi:hypothetical protein
VKKQPRPSASKFSVLRQLCNLIPSHLVPKLARETGVDKACRTFSAWSHVVAMLYAQLTHSIGLNDVCDALRLHSGPLSALRGATPPSRNGLSHAGKERTAVLAEKLFWSVLAHLQTLSPEFARGRRGRGVAHRFRRAIHIVDSTTLELVAKCMDWAKHRRRKAAAKCHMRLDLQSFLPAFALVDTARHNDAKRAREVCAGVQAGEIVVFDKAYVDFNHLYDLFVRGVFWVTRTKSSHCFTVLKRRKITSPNILADEEVVLSRKAAYGVEREQCRRPLSLSLGYRSVLQANQANPQTCGLSRSQCQRRPLAGLECPALLPAAALSGIPFGLGKQLHPAFHSGPLCSLAALGPACAFEKLWDSRW